MLEKINQEDEQQEVPAEGLFYKPDWSSNVPPLCVGDSIKVEGEGVYTCEKVANYERGVNAMMLHLGPGPFSGSIDTQIK